MVVYLFRGFQSHMHPLSCSKNSLQTILFENLTLVDVVLTSDDQPISSLFLMLPLWKFHRKVITFQCQVEYNKLNEMR